MLFTETVENWKDWGRVFQSIPAFTPLAQEICRREGLPWVGLSPLTPGTNGVFHCGDAVLKIFFPKESGLDPALDFHRELAVSQWAAKRGSPPRRCWARGWSLTSTTSTTSLPNTAREKRLGPGWRTATPAQRLNL